MNQKQKKALLIFSSLLFMCALFVIYVRTADLLGNYIPVDGYYQKVTALTRAGNYALAIGALICPLFSFATMKKIARVPENRGVMFLFSNASLAVSLLACGIVLTVSILKNGIAWPNTNAFAAALLCGFFSLVGCVFFTSNVFLRRSDRKISTVFCICISLAFVAYMMYLYYEPLVHLNAPVKLLRQMSLVALALFFINEASFGAGKKFSESYVGFGLAGAFLTLCDSIPNLTFGIITGVPLTSNHNYLSDTLILVAFIYLVVRLCSIAQRRPEVAVQFMDDLIRKAKDSGNDENTEDDTERLILEFSGGVQTSLFDEIESDAENESEAEEYQTSEVVEETDVQIKDEEPPTE